MSTYHKDWTPWSWQNRSSPYLIEYQDEPVAKTVIAQLQQFPPLVTVWEVDKLKRLLAEAEAGKRFILQGGDCAETLADCSQETIVNKFKILLQMSLVLIHGGQKPVIRIGRFAGQYAKPRSQLRETQVHNGQPLTLPSYLGDLINAPEFSPTSRNLDPTRMITGYMHAALTLNLIRALSSGGFADLHHPEKWDLTFANEASLTPALREEYQATSQKLASALRFMEALGETSIDELTRVEFFTSHEGLHLAYEAAQTRWAPEKNSHYDLTTHLPWIGDRTRALDGPHVEFFRGIENPIGVKIGPTTTPSQLVDTCHALNPYNERGKLLLIARLGADVVNGKLPPLLEAYKQAHIAGLWLCDPMHGNTTRTSSGRKTRDFNAILREIEHTFNIHQKQGTRFCGVHFELTGDDVSECTGGAADIKEGDLERHYATACDPRLNYRQALEMAFRIAKRMNA